MQVTSPEFFVFTLLVCGGLFLLGTADRAKKLLLIAASLYFYATFDARFVVVLLYLTVLSHGAGLLVISARTEARRKTWLLASIVAGLLPLCVYKYLPAIALGLAPASSPVGLGGVLDDLVLPIGISFYTFQAISYPLDLYRGTLTKSARLLDLACFITFFPKLLLGPITRAGQFLPQLAQPLRVANREAAASALWLILQGLIKKLVFADILADQFVDPAFDAPSEHGAAFLVVAVFAYSFQIYFDLAGYTDIVRGASRLLGFELPINFNRPYLAASISNFWQRWHISMSSFFRDYLYFAVGGSKRGNVYINLLITFTAIGVWHGAGWNFVLYGLLHGSLVGWERFRRERRRRAGQHEVPAGARLLLAIASTFFIVAWARLLFRAPTLGDSVAYVRALANWTDLTLPVTGLGLAVLVMSALLHFSPPSWANALHARLVGLPSVIQAGVAGIGIFLCLALPSASAGFIYAQF